MKKYALLVLTCLLVLTGCGKKGNEVVCTGKVSDDSMEYTMKLIAEFEKDKVSKVKAEMIFDNEDNAKKYGSLLELMNNFADEDKKIDFERKGKTITFKNYSQLADAEDDDDIKFIGLSKEEFKKAATAGTEDVTCK